MDTAKYHRFIDAISTDIVGSNTPNQQSDTMSSPAAEKSLSDARAALLDRASRCKDSTRTRTPHSILHDPQVSIDQFAHSQGLLPQQIPAVFPDVVGFSATLARDDTFDGYWQDRSISLGPRRSGKLKRHVSMVSTSYSSGGRWKKDAQD
jgi:hypothetical protein